MKVEFFVSMGLHSEEKVVVEYEGDITDEELDKEWSDWTMNSIDGYWKKLED